MTANQARAAVREAYHALSALRREEAALRDRIDEAVAKYEETVEDALDAFEDATLVRLPREVGVAEARVEYRKRTGRWPEEGV